MLKKYGFSLLKLSAMALLTVAMLIQYKKLNDNPDLLQKLTDFYKRPYALTLSCILVLLTLVNYLIESKKWIIILHPLQKLSLQNALKSVFTGVLFSIFTPARVGELGGRVVLLKSENRLAGSAAVLIGSVAQNICILILGLFGLNYLMHFHNYTTPTILASISILSVLLSLITLFVFYNIDKAIPLIKKLPWPEKWRPYFRKFIHLSSYDSGNLSWILLLSLLRILVWTLQYLIIMWVLVELNIDVFAVSVIWLIFLIQTGVPLPPISGLVARSGVAIYMWSIIQIDEWNALAATFVIYFYNLIIPSCIGLFVLIFNRKIINESV